jgi:putative DNA primase/helicase
MPSRDFNAELIEGGIDTLRDAGSNAETFYPEPDDLALAALPLNDYGNAQRLKARFGHDLRFVEQQGWFVWNGKRWQKASSRTNQIGGKVTECAHLTVQAIQQEIEAVKRQGAKSNQGQEQHDKILATVSAFARSAGNQPRIRAMIEAAAPYLQIDAADLDADPDCLNTDNCTLQLDRQRLEVIPRGHRREDLITQVTRVPFDADADCPRFRSFLDRILPDDETQIFVQTYLGSCLCGDATDQRILFFEGKGANGKSTLLSILRLILDDLAVTIPFASLSANSSRRGSDATPDLIPLARARVVMAAEPEVGTRLSEGQLKAMTGGEPMMVRELYGPAFEITPNFKLILSFNNPPKIIAQDEGTWRRIAVVQFNVTIPADERQAHLAQRLVKEEGSGILNWLLDGWRIWAERGLRLPDTVRRATDSYRADNDPLADFLESCVYHAEGDSIQAGPLHARYIVWCQSNGKDAVSQTRFGKILKEKGYRKSTINGRVIYHGIGLLQDLPAENGGAEKGAHSHTSGSHHGYSDISRRAYGADIPDM